MFTPKKTKPRFIIIIEAPQWKPSSECCINYNIREIVGLKRRLIQLYIVPDCAPLIKPVHVIRLCCTRHNVRIFHIHIGFTNHDKPMSVLNWHYVAVENTSNWYIKDSYTHTMTIVASTFRYKVDIIMTKKYQRLVYIKLTSNRCRIDIKRLLFNTSV